MFVLENPSSKFLTVPAFICDRLKGLPLTIHHGSRRYPLDLVGRQQVSVTWQDQFNERVIPIFAPQNEQGQISVDGRFILLWYPEVPTNNEQQREYSRLVQPAVLCRSITGFYLGELQDPHVCYFTKTQDTGDHTLCLVEEGSYLTKGPKKSIMVQVKTS